jgi:hypothetical protein
MQNTAGTHGDAGGDVRTYANDLRVTYSLAEFFLDFSQRYGPDTKTVQCRIVTSPTNMIAFQRALETAVVSYEASYGAIPRLPEDAAEARPKEG